MREVLLILLIPLALSIIQTRKLRNAIILLSAFSLITSVIYLLYHAPDVAIAEAVIGTTISTVLYLVAMQKYRIFTVYVVLNDMELDDSVYYDRSKDPMIETVEKFCSKQGLELHAIYTVESLDHLIATHHNATIISETTRHHIIYGRRNHLKTNELVTFLKTENIAFEYMPLLEVDYES